MCTVSLAYSTSGDALRLVINRDEQRRRMHARPPAVFPCEGVDAVWPVDLQNGGTWTAVNAHGVAFALLNVTAGDPPVSDSSERITRGAIIPAIAAARDVDEAERRFASGAANWPCRPFKLIVASLDRVAMLTPHGASDIVIPVALGTSSLGDELVDAPRRALFADLLQTSESAWQAQDRLHQHSWPDRRHLSVLMSRADAGTVSRTAITIARNDIEMRYAVIRDGWPMGISVPAIAMRRLRAVVAA